MRYRVTARSDPAPRTPEEDRWALYADALPERHRDYYLKEFRRVDAGKALGLSWNWAALLFTFSWLRYRRMHRYSRVYLFVSAPVLLFLFWLAHADRCAAGMTRTVFPNVLLGLLLAGYVLPALFANRLYFRFVRKQIAVAQRLVTGKEALEQRFRRSLGTAANWGSWTVMTAVVVFTLWAAQAHVGVEIRARVGEVVSAGSAYRYAVTKFFADNGRFPVNLEEIGSYFGPHRCVSAITLEKDGSIRVVAGFQPLAGKSVILTPTVRGREIVSWTCRGGDIPAKYLPGSCT